MENLQHTIMKQLHLNFTDVILIHLILSTKNKNYRLLLSPIQLTNPDLVKKKKIE